MEILRGLRRNNSIVFVADQPSDGNEYQQESNPPFFYSNDELMANIRDATPGTIICNVTTPIPSN